MGRLNYFLSGTFLGGVLLLNQTYETERLKETVQSHAEERQRIASMDLSELTTIRHQHKEQSQCQVGGGLNGHYDYLMFNLINAAKEKLLNAALPDQKVNECVGVYAREDLTVEDIKRASQ
ncbi:hypothetical protein FGO68_gene5944 [Halteria grandinella]|uniref:Uncharacterized protein n=1 Tax=Halteria grandinella TaxID=5974 RepID=A0A8J8SWQ9_HALGN|nr:hypothetical protein FGO68_gene5944 [Halteria grandinella]